MSYLDPYISRSQLARYLRINTTLTEEEAADLDTACREATTEVTNHCARNFNRDEPGTGWEPPTSDTPTVVPGGLYVDTAGPTVYSMTGTAELPAWTAFGGTVHDGAGDPVDGTTDGATGDLYRDTDAFDLDPLDGWYRCTDGTANTWEPVTVLAADGAPVDAAGPTTRVFAASRPDLLQVDDFWTTTDLVVEVDGQVIDPDQYQCEPLNRIRDGVMDWSYFTLRALVGNWPVDTRARVRITAHFGWEYLPDVVTEASKMIGGETFKMREAPLGVAGWSEFGAIRVRDIPKVAKMLYPFQIRRVLATRR